MNNRLALGTVETLGLTTSVYVLDVMCKTAEVDFIGYKKTGSGKVTIMVEGEVDAVSVAVEAGIEAGKKLGVIFAHSVIARPDELVVPPLHKMHKIGFSLNVDKKPTNKVNSRKDEIDNTEQNTVLEAKKSHKKETSNLKAKS